jgi:ribonuclease HI
MSKSHESTPEVQLFADGACSGNPGPGGWAFVLRHPASGKEIERSGGDRDTTNNRMELTAVIRGLDALKRPSSVEIVTDSQYVGKGFSEWLPKWKANGWRRREGSQWKPIKNEDLWRQLDALLARHTVRFTHVRGHAGHPENERCDTLAVAACQKYR